MSSRTFPSVPQARHGEQGFALVSVLLLAAVLLTLMTALLNSGMVEIFMAGNSRTHRQVVSAANGAIEHLRGTYAFDPTVTTPVNVSATLKADANLSADIRNLLMPASGSAPTDPRQNGALVQVQNKPSINQQIVLKASNSMMSSDLKGETIYVNVDIYRITTSTQSGYSRKTLEAYVARQSMGSI